MTTTTSRLLNLLPLLQTRRDWPGPVLARRLEISPRTVRRDVDRLRDMGYSIHSTMGPDGGYRLDAGSELPPLLFDDDQVIALAVALQAATVTGIGIGEAALRALTTVRQVMPSRLRHRLDSLDFTTISGLAGEAPVDPVTPEVLLALSAAVRGREVLRFDYVGPRVDAAVAEATTPEAAPAAARRVEPHHLVTHGRRWYLVAWDLYAWDLDARDQVSGDAGAWRIFRADRISLRTPNGPRFSPRELPGGDVTAYVSARFRGSAVGDRWPCTGRVVLGRSASSVLPFVGDGIVEDLGPNQCGLELGSWSWVALAAALNRFETDVVVVEPSELREAFAVLAARNTATATR